MPMSPVEYRCRTHFARMCGKIRIWFVWVLVLAASACAPATSETGFAAQPGPATSPAEIDLSAHFEAFGAHGAFVLHDSAANRLTIHDAERARQRFLPASTFKILNSLIALETGVLTDEGQVLKWDGVDRGWSAWNRDHSMATAFPVSAVWFYQEVARRVGEQRMRGWVRRAGYGNAEIGGGIDQFWLSGELRISPEEQVDFVKRLHRGELPFSARNQAIVRDVMLLEEKNGYVLRGKTGWARANGTNYGWLVGWVEKPGNTYYFATQIESDAESFPMRRVQQEITRGVLQELSILP